MAIPIADVETARRQILDLKARHLRALELHDWTGLRDLLAPDVSIEVAGLVAGKVETETAHGIDAVLDRLRRSGDEGAAVHAGRLPTVHLLDGDEATGVWAMRPVAALRPGDGTDDLLHYAERYRRVAGRWSIASMQLRRLAAASIPR